MIDITIKNGKIKVKFYFSKEDTYTPDQCMKIAQ